MRFSAIIVAAGQGARAPGIIPKQYRQLGVRPVLAWSVEACRQAGADQILVLIHPAHVELCRAAIGDLLGVRWLPGGASRTASVRAGLAAVGSTDAIVIHDAARPGLSPDIVSDVLAALETADAAAPALPVTDSLRRTTGEEVTRDGVLRVQTPQAFRAEIIRAAYAAAAEDAVFTDDLSVVQRVGARIKLIDGDIRLMKLTYPEDFDMAERLLVGARDVCVGAGYDAHRFGPGDHVTLCGVRIAHDKGLIGHSDADAGWHALVDAILGALGEGDIGAHFPPSDPQWKAASSETFLRHAAALIMQAGARLTHVDVTLVCERPKIGPHREAMRAATARVLGLPLSRVSVKATTTERMGFTGREEGLAAQATATVER